MKTFSKWLNVEPKKFGISNIWISNSFGNRSGFSGNLGHHRELFSTGNQNLGGDQNQHFIELICKMTKVN